MDDNNKLIEERRAKLKALRNQGFAYPNDYRREHLAAAEARGHRTAARPFDLPGSGRRCAEPFAARDRTITDGRDVRKPFRL